MIGRRARVTQTLKFGSGKIALLKDDNVYIDLGENTVWVYDVREDEVPRKLLYTFNSREQAKEYLVLKK